MGAMKDLAIRIAEQAENPYSREWTGNSPTTFTQCDVCGCLHPYGRSVNCIIDSTRYLPTELNRHYGRGGWTIK